MFSKKTKVFALVALFMNAQAVALLAQATAPATTSPAGPPDVPPISDAELEQLVAPVALYPDSLVSQIFMASTYPLEVVQADRFAKANPKLTGDALTKQLEKQDWDASVKSLVNFPTVLAVMSEKLDSTIKLGDAVLDDQARVMNAVQKLRAKAKDQGNLKTNEQQIVNVAPATPAPPAASSSSSTTVYTAPPTTQVITIEPANPQVIYVPTYNPTVVYGTWPYPAYPPYAYYPPGYAVGAGLVGFGLGVAAGAAWGYAWGNCNWGGGDVDIDYNKNTNINNNIDRSKYQDRANQASQNRDQRQSNRDTNQADRQGNRDTRQTDRGANSDARQGTRDTRQTDRQGNRDTRQGDRGGGNSWQHDPSHRQGVSYRDNATNQKFGGADNRSVQSREAYRGRADTGRQQINNGAANQYRGQNAPSPSNRANAGAGGAQNRANAGGAQNRANAGGVQNRAGGGQTANPGANRPSSNNRGSSATNRGSSGGFSGVGGGGNSTRSASQRGSSSRSSSGASRGGGSRGGGGGRGGGGRR